MNVLCVSTEPDLRTNLWKEIKKTLFVAAFDYLFECFFLSPLFDLIAFRLSCLASM